MQYLPVQQPGRGFQPTSTQSTDLCARLQGLGAGSVTRSAVEFRGIPIGEVIDVRAQIDLKTFEFSVPVTIHLDPTRLGVKILDSSPGIESRNHAQEIELTPW